jgi:hypothetical protein
MNHADRQRLSQLLTEIATTDDCGELIAEARAIVDGPTGIIRFTEQIDTDMAAKMKAAFEAATETGKIRILTEPIHEYQPIEAYGLRLIAGNHQARRTRLTTAAALALASIALTAATATNTPTPGPSHQPTPQPAANQPPRAAQDRFPATHIPYLPGHGPGTPGNGLGVTTP